MTLTVITLGELTKRFNALSPEEQAKQLKKDKLQYEECLKRKKLRDEQDEKEYKEAVRAKKEFILLFKLRRKAQQVMETPTNRFILDMLVDDDNPPEFDLYDYTDELEKLKKEIDESIPESVHPIKLTVEILKALKEPLSNVKV